MNANFICPRAICRKDFKRYSIEIKSIVSFICGWPCPGLGVRVTYIYCVTFIYATYMQVGEICESIWVTSRFAES